MRGLTHPSSGNIGENVLNKTKLKKLDNNLLHSFRCSGKTASGFFVFVEILYIYD
jgi:hypothetical protein